MVGGQSPVVVPTMGGQPLAQVQAEALQTPVVQPVAPVDQTVVNVPVATTTPVVEAPKDTTPPKVLTDRWTGPRSESSVSWNDNTKKNSCSNCIVVVTDEPTSIKLEYLLWDNSRNVGGAFDVEYPEETKIWDDNGKISTI
jgi:hypothetical protein